jgi:hypothetical protein
VLHPGQTVLTDRAFMHYQELQLSVCDVFDHGRFRFGSVAADVGLKELLPARLLGRSFPGLQRSALVAGAATQLLKGYHDSPRIDAPVCIGFCNASVPQARGHQLSASSRSGCPLLAWHACPRILLVHRHCNESCFVEHACAMFVLSGASPG